jgi:hypothetical protein
VILDGISTTIGDDLHLPRTKILTQLLEQMERSRPSLRARRAAEVRNRERGRELLARDHFVFAFRAES